MIEFYQGRTLTIWLREKATAAWDEAEAGVPGNRRACKAQFRARIKQLADVGTLHGADHFNGEGNGIYAVKATCGLRAYGWFDRVNGRRAFVIGHVILKKKQKLDPADRERAEKEREQLAAEQLDRKS